MSLVLDPATHRYSDGTDRRWTSVSQVINAVMAKSFDGVDPAVLANAAERGRRVEDYATEILRTGGCTIQADEREDVVERVGGFYRWYEEMKPELKAAQFVVNDEASGIAGCLDYFVDLKAKLWLVDLKCTAQPEASWALQIGAYCSMSPRFCDGLAVLHINPKYAKGWIWREYDPLIVRSQWQSALGWWKTLQTLKVK